MDREFGLSRQNNATTTDREGTYNNSLLEGNHRFKVHLYLPTISRIVHHPTLVDAVRKALRTPHIVLWSSDLNIKLPQTKHFFSAHQDATYTGLEPAHKCLTVWVALSDPVGITEGCMSFLKSSQKFGQLSHLEEPAGDHSSNNYNMLSRSLRVDIVSHKELSKKDWVSISLRAGEATLHHFHTIHQSGPNQHPTKPRVGLALRYMVAGVRQTGPVRESVTWIDNPTDSNNNMKRKEVEEWFDLEPQLPLLIDGDSTSLQESIEAGRIAHEEAMKREANNYFHDSVTLKAYDAATSRYHTLL